VSEQPNLAVVHTLFMREHNRIAGQLQQINPGWDDERLYQEAKRVVNAQWQHIVYNEFLPMLLGETYMNSYGLWPLTSGFSADYRDDFDPRATNEFAAAAFRVGHTFIPRLVEAVALVQFGNNRGQTLSRQNLRNLFFNIDGLRTANGVDEMISGITLGPAQAPDDNFVEDVRNETSFVWASYFHNYFTL
jgi:peroxidase